ncbi:MAG: sugar phosphate isomerase/epimerase [Candidatus Scalindua rubra]|uniref:Endonuclease 4 n=1 Tax=Candidatus Scalindua brodae TaxID=237368 RepID=A0A0B0ED64_9BACT|nr:MAG: endonuclease 4 [Candidatus Scalindua brodae]MBZ0109641.1 sugar phosphate isomerase/epimerase [Candidatus Scalindua rubra]TWU33104.1 endonuclease 4 [Candidatus Brocadiaceae bacterium S225]
MDFHLKLGLKLWSSNTFYIKPALELHLRGVFDYVELYVDPGSGKNLPGKWKKSGLPFCLHVPHAYSGFNLSQRKCQSENLSLLKEVEFYRLALEPEFVIFHPGIQGSIDETVRQIHDMKKVFPDIFNLAIIENKPKIGLKGEICVGASPGEIEQIIEETDLGFCLDIGHAICYAAWAQIGWGNVVDQFMKLGPKVYHLSDGNMNSHKDLHLHYGDGDYELSKIIKLIPSDVYVSVETDKDPELHLNDFERDVNYLKNLSEMSV